MSATSKAKAHLKQLSPHLMYRRSAKLIQALIEENEKQRELLQRALVQLQGREEMSCLEFEIELCLKGIDVVEDRG